MSEFSKSNIRYIKKNIFLAVTPMTILTLFPGSIDFPIILTNDPGKEIAMGSLEHRKEGIQWKKIPLIRNQKKMTYV